MFELSRVGFQPASPRRREDAEDVSPSYADMPSIGGMFRRAGVALADLEGRVNLEWLVECGFVYPAPLVAECSMVGI